MFSNPNITFELTNKENLDTTSLAIFQIYDLEGKSDEYVYQLMLQTLERFRKDNFKHYTFTSTCPVCFEESTQIDYLKHFCDCKHQCCLQCWKDNCMAQYRSSHDPLHCISCSKQIPYHLILENELIPTDEQSNYSLRLYQQRYQNISECPNCHNQYVYRNIDRSICPTCSMAICNKCMQRAHDKIGLTCKQFEQFMTTKEYIDFVKQEEEERLELEVKRSKVLHGRLFAEMMIEINLRKERKRQEELAKYNKMSEQWILKNTKQCPNCKKPIEKNKGCNHMTCSQCKYEFCWYCFNECKHPAEHFRQCPAGAKWFDDNYRD